MDKKQVTPSKKLLTAKQVAKDKLDCSISYLYKKMASGEFPQPDVRQGRAIRWLESTVDAHIDSLVAQTKGGEIICPIQY